MNPTCRGCGHALKHKAKYCARCGTPAADARVCPSCGIANDAGDNFCYACGEALVGGSPPPAPRRDSARVRWLAAGILLGAVLSGAGALGWWLLDR
ncbi:MAG: zinc ribbon domain-containing protein [Sandaracinaceae bacterium]|nr:zinc ribbon domain-containing protein [Sandaracinaceae bacterium]